MEDVPAPDWRQEHLWCALALSANARLPDGDPWTTQVFAVADPDRLPASPEETARVLRQELAGMQEPVDEPSPTWMSGGTALLSGEPVPLGATGTVDLPERVPLLVAGKPLSTDLPTALLGFRVREPLLGLVAVVRGYLTGVSVASPLGPALTTSAWVWHAGGQRWPAEMSQREGQPAVAAFAASRTDAAQATLAYRVPAVDQTLPPGASEQWVDLAKDGNLGFASLLANAPVALACAVGHELPVPGSDAALFQPAWLVGRWWLHEVLAALRQWKSGRGGDAEAGPSGDGQMGVPEPLFDVGASWDTVRSDQLADQRLGALLSPAEARLLPALLLSATAASRTPTQQSLWDAIVDETEGDDEGEDLVRQIREAWEQWPDLHEADRFPAP